jgi:hypothetical protein
VHTYIYDCKENQKDWKVIFLAGFAVMRDYLIPHAKSQNPIKDMLQDVS